MEFRSLDTVTNNELNQSLKALYQSDRENLAEIVLHLAEVGKRESYRELGYSSLFTYAVEYLNSSKAAAYERTEGARALRNSPELYVKIKSGKVFLCALVMPQ